jgi:predicted transcriptional regulator of viral defense system
MRSSDFFANHPVFTHEDYLAAHGARGGRSPRTADSLLTRYTAAGKVLHVRRGLYAAVPAGASPQDVRVDPFLLATKLAPDAAVAYHAALQLRGLAHSAWARFAVLTRSHVRPLCFQQNELFGVRPSRALDGLPDLGGGVETVPHAGGVVRVTTIERTLVDVLDCPDLGGGWEEIWRSLERIERLEIEAVLGHALELRSALTAARVGFFLDRHREALLVEERQLELLREAAPRQPRYLDSKRAAGRLVKPWNLVVPEHLLERRWEGTVGAPAELAEELLEAMAEIDRSEYVGLSLEQLEHAAATGEWPGTGEAAYG